MNKKAYTKTINTALDKFFSNPDSDSEADQYTNDDNVTKHIKNTNDVNITNHANDTNNDNIANHTKHTRVYNDTNITRVTNKSKHYDERGKRSERYGLLLDNQLKNDLRLLSNATGSSSVNDLIVTILLDYVNQENNQERLKQYKKLIQE